MGIPAVQGGPWKQGRVGQPIRVDVVSGGAVMRTYWHPSFALAQQLGCLAGVERCVFCCMTMARIAMTPVPNLEGDQVAAALLAVDAQAEEREFAYPALHLYPHTQRPDVLELERCPTTLPLFSSSL